MKIITVETWNVTELNTRKKTFSNDIKDLFYGDSYIEHKFETFEKAKVFELQLNKKGVMTNLTHNFTQKYI